MKLAWMSAQPELVATVVIVVILIVAFLVYLTVRAHRGKVSTGPEGLIGERGVYKGSNRVLVHGELWHVEDPDGLEQNDKVEVTSVDHMSVKVRKR